MLISYRNGHLGDIFGSLISPVLWVQTFLAFKLTGMFRGIQRCLWFCSRMLIRYRNRHLGDIFASLINLVQWVRTFFGLQIDGQDQRNPTVSLVLL